jgi:hypothetical protein
MAGKDAAGHRDVPAAGHQHSQGRLNSDSQVLSAAADRLPGSIYGEAFRAGAGSPR